MNNTITSNYEHLKDFYDNNLNIDNKSIYKHISNS